MSTKQKNKEIIRRFVNDVFNEKRLDRIDDYMAENYVEHTPAAPEAIKGRGSIREHYAGTHTAFPDFEVRIEDLIAEGNKVVQRSQQVGTHEGEFMNVPPTENRINVSGIVIYQIEDGKIVESWVQADMMGMMQQLGVLDGPGG